MGSQRANEQADSDAGESDHEPVVRVVACGFVSGCLVAECAGNAAVGEVSVCVADAKWAGHGVSRWLVCCWCDGSEPHLAGVAKVPREVVVNKR